VKLFGSKSCASCESCQEELQAAKEELHALQTRYAKLSDAYRHLQRQNAHQESPSSVSLSQSDLSALFGRIKNASLSKDMKRYLRSVVMLIELSGDGNLYQFLVSQLKSQKS